MHEASLSKYSYRALKTGGRPVLSLLARYESISSKREATVLAISAAAFPLIQRCADRSANQVYEAAHTIGEDMLAADTRNADERAVEPARVRSIGRAAARRQSHRV